MSLSTQNPFIISETIDSRGLRCPLPLLYAKQALKKMPAGDYLEVLATDPTAKDDFDAMLLHLPHQLVEYTSGSEYDRFVIKKVGGTE